MNWELELHRQHQRELIAEAAELRLAQAVQEDEEAGSPTYNPALAWAGERLAMLTRAMHARTDESIRRN